MNHTTLAMLMGAIPVIGAGLPNRPMKWEGRSDYANNPLSADLQAEKIRKAQEKRERKAKAKEACDE